MTSNIKMLFHRQFALALLTSLLSITCYANSKNEATDFPQHSSAKSYGTGWKCDKGYREINNACIAVIVPDNAYPTNKTYGRGWECNRGYDEVNNSCKLISIPANGYLDHSGERVKCNRGYLLIDKSCNVVNVPKNGFIVISTYGPGWSCERGYRANKNECLELKIPANAHLDYSGNNWECNRPYYQSKNQCALPDRM